MGVESEFFVVDRQTLEPRDCLDALARHSAFGSMIKPEVVHEQIEIVSEAVRTVAELRHQMCDLLADVLAIVDAEGAVLLPVTMLETDRFTWTDDPRLRRLSQHLGGCFRQNAAMIAADQINLGGTDEADAFRSFNCFRELVGELVGIAAASPFRKGRVNGVACNRLKAYDTALAVSPDHSVPRALHSLADYERFLTEASLFGDPNSCYAYLRPMPQRGVAVELRCIDKQPSLHDTLAMAALAMAITSAGGEDLFQSAEPAGESGAGASAERLLHARRGGVVDPARTRRFLETLRPYFATDEEPYLASLLATAEAGGMARRLVAAHRRSGRIGAQRLLIEGLAAEVRVPGGRPLVRSPVYA